MGRRTSAMLTAAIVGAVALAPLAVVPAAAAPASSAVAAAPIAAAKAAPRLTVSKTRTSVTKVKTYRMTTTYRLPVLTGSTAKNRSLVTRHAKKILAAERKALAGWRGACSPSSDPAFVDVTDVDAAIYRGRYASVTMELSLDGGCGGYGYQEAKSFTLDLTTGKTVTLGRFAAPSAATTRLATVSALKAQNKGCTSGKLTARKGKTYSVPSPSAWNVSAPGLRVWFDRDLVGERRCGVVSALVPWTDVATTTALAGRSSTRVYVKGEAWDEVMGYVGDIAILTVKGSQATLFRDYRYKEMECAVGVRTGTTAAMFDVGSAKRTTRALTGATTAPEVTLGAGWAPATPDVLEALAYWPVMKDARAFCTL